MFRNLFKSAVQRKPSVKTTTLTVSEYVYLSAIEKLEFHRSRNEEADILPYKKDIGRMISYVFTYLHCKTLLNEEHHVTNFKPGTASHQMYYEMLQSTKIDDQTKNTIKEMIIGSPALSWESQGGDDWEIQSLKMGLYTTITIKRNNEDAGHLLGSIDQVVHWEDPDFKNDGLLLLHELYKVADELESNLVR